MGRSLLPEVTGAQVLIDAEQPVPLAFETANELRAQDPPPASRVMVVDILRRTAHRRARSGCIRLARSGSEPHGPSLRLHPVEGIEAQFDALLNRGPLREWRHPGSFSTIYVWETRVESP
jgi:hypothetical protein